MQQLVDSQNGNQTGILQQRQALIDKGRNTVAQRLWKQDMQKRIGVGIAEKLGCLLLSLINGLYATTQNFCEICGIVQKNASIAAVVRSRRMPR